MDVAVTGKGGVGKTALTAMLARAFAAAGQRVLAADLDSNPGLAFSLGVALPDRGLPDEAIMEKPGTRPYGWTLADGLTASEAVRRYATPVSDGVVLLGVGSIDRAAHKLHHTIGAVRRVVAEFDEPGWVTIADLEAGPATPFEGFTRPAGVGLVLVEPTRASLASAERVLSILQHDDTPCAVVVNRARPGDVELVEQALGQAVVDSVPFDPEVARLEREGSLAELSADGPAATAARRLAGRLTRMLDERPERQEEMS